MWVLSRGRLVSISGSWGCGGWESAVVAQAVTGSSALSQEVSARPAEPPQSRQPCLGSWCFGGAGLWAVMTSSCRQSSSSSCTPPGESWGDTTGLSWRRKG